MTTTIQDVRKANKQWFSPDNIGDIEYRVLHDTFKRPYLVRSTAYRNYSDLIFRWTIGHRWNINLINLRTLEIGPLLEKDFDSLIDVKRYLKMNSTDWEDEINLQTFIQKELR